MSIKPWNDKIFAEPEILDASAELEAAIKGKKVLFQTEGDPTRDKYKTRPGHIKPIWLEGEKLAGKATRHFAWVGLPKKTDGKKVPAMVLVHGGGGTAFLRWVEMWNKRGYAAIAVDTCGHLPVARQYNKTWSNHDYLPGWTWGEFADADKPVKQQWGYHAVVAVVRAHSYLRSLPQIDNRKIGITGVSWGGFLTTIVSSIDSRFRFAAPVYGCGFLEHDSPWVENFKNIGPAKTKRWVKLWDPKNYLPLSKVPTLWTTGSNDFAYNQEMLQLSKQACGAKAMTSVHIRFGHSHQAGWKLKEPYAFADSFCKGGPKLTPPKISVKDTTVEVKNTDIKKAVLCYTKDTTRLPERYWKQRKIKKNSADKLLIDLPADITGWFVNVTDSSGSLTTSDVTLM